MEVKIDIKELSRLYIETAYQGKKNTAEGTSYEVMLAKEEDALVLMGYVSDAADELCSSFSVFSPHRMGDDLVFDLPASWDESEEPSLRSSVLAFVSAMTTARWMRYTNAEDEAKYQKDAMEAKSRIYKIVYKRKRPVRPASCINDACCDEI